MKIKKILYGISLLELMLSLAIIAILLVMATRYFTLARSIQQTNEAVNMLQTTMTAVDNWFWTFKKFKGTPNGDISVANLVSMNLLPKDFARQQINPWGGNLFVVAQGDTRVSIELDNVSFRDCKTLQNSMAKKDLTSFCPQQGNTFIVLYPHVRP